jgi:hypothetical protein
MKWTVGFVICIIILLLLIIFSAQVANYLGPMISK